MPGSTRSRFHLVSKSWSASWRLLRRGAPSCTSCKIPDCVVVHKNKTKKLVQIPVAIYFHVLYLPEFRGRHPGEEFRLRDVDLGHFVIDRSSRPIILFVLSVVFPIAFLIRRDGSAPQTRRSNQTKCCYYYTLCFFGFNSPWKNVVFFYAINKTAPG